MAALLPGVFLATAPVFAYYAGNYLPDPVGASLVVVAATLGMFGIPVEGIALILPIDHFCDMGRSATNVVGNAIATSVVSKWEGELGH